MQVFKTEEEARAHQDDELLVPVNGVFVLLPIDVYQFWKNKPAPCDGCSYRHAGCHGNCLYGYLEWAASKRVPKLMANQRLESARGYASEARTRIYNWKMKHSEKNLRWVFH